MPTIRKLGEKEVEEKEEIYSKEKLVLSKTLNVEFVYKLNKDLEEVLIPKKKVNYMPDNSDEEQQVPKKEKDLYFSQKELKQKIEKYINECDQKEKQEKKDKERKVDKMVTLSYKDNQLINKLCRYSIIQ